MSKVQEGIQPIRFSMIPDEIVEEVRSASDVLDVVGEYVQLKKRGSNFFGLCPFHSENTPSFSVNPQLGIYKCFGCGVGGDVFHFVTSIEGITFPEAIRMLAARAGIDVPETNEDREQAGETEAIYEALRFAARYFYECLTHSDDGRPALRYLRDRGFSKETIKSFGLGFSPAGWDSLLSSARAHHISEHILQEAGLVIPRKEGSGFYDRFRARIMFPIFSHLGRVVGFGARTLRAGAKGPKYINSPETRVYNKSRVLYGLMQAKYAIRESEEALLVEGYTDVISLHQAGIKNAVASSGTALTLDQVRLLGRYAKRVLLLYDADTAGAGAARRGIDIILEQGLSAYLVELPHGEDPDSFARSKGDALEKYLDSHRRDFVTYLFERSGGHGESVTPEDEAERMHDVVSAIARLPDPLMRESYIRRASEVLGVPDIRLHEALAREQSTRGGERAKRHQAEPTASGQGSKRQAIDRAPPALLERSRAPSPLPEEKSLIRLMLVHGASMVEFILGCMSLEEFTDGPARHAAKHFLSQYESGIVEAKPFLDGSYGSEVQQLAAEVSVRQHEPSENWERKQNISVPKLDRNPYEAAASAMTLLKLDRVKAAIDKQREEIFRASKAGVDVRRLQAEMMALHDLRRRIERREFLQE